MKKSPLKEVLNSLHPVGRTQLPFFIGATLVEAAGVVLLGFAVSTILSCVLLGETVDHWYLLILGLSLGARFIADLLQKRLSLKTAAMCDEVVRHNVVTRLSQNPQNIDGESFSSLFGRAIPSIIEYYRSYFPILRKSITVPPILLLVVFYTDLISGLILLVAAFSTIVLLILTGNLSKKTKNRQWQELRSIRRYFIEIVAGGETMRQLGAVDRFRESMKERSDRFRELTLDVLKVVFASSFALELMSSISVALVAVILGIRLIDGSCSYQAALMTLILIPELFGYIRQLGAARHTVMEAESAAPLVWRFQFDDQQADVPPDDSPNTEKQAPATPPFSLGPAVFFAMVLTMAAHFSQMGLMVASAMLLSRCALQTPISALHVLVAGVRFLGLARPVLRYLERLSTHYIALLFFKRIRLYLFDRLSSLDSRTLRQLHSGEVLRTMDSDLEKLDNVGPRIVWPLFAAIIVAIVLPFIPPFSTISPRWLFIALLWVIILLPWVFYTRLLEPSGTTNVERQALDFAHGLKDSTFFDPESKLSQRLMDTAEKVVSKGTAAQWQISLIQGISLILIYMTWGMTLFNHGKLGGESLALVVFGIMSFTELFRSMPFVVTATKASAAAYDRLLKLLSHSTAGVQPAPGQPSDSAEFLEIKGLTWTWPGSSEPLFQNLNLRLGKGGIYGWIGPVGSGKSTLLDIVTGFLSIPRGKVFLGGFDVSETSQSVLLENVCYVSQRSFIFDGSIKDNLQLANPDISDIEMEKLLNLVGLSPSQYDINKDLGENGITLSGGERQRLILARAMAQDKAIVLLDEPFNNLDRNTQDQILQWMKNEAGLKTFVMITHQAYGLDVMDQVISLFEGQ